MPPGRRVSGTTVRPCAGVRGRRCTRGSPVSGAPTSSSSGTWWARASGSSSSSVGRRCPDSSLDSVLTEVPVSSDSCVRVSPRRWRSARSRGPTAVSTASVVAPSSAMPVICRFGNVRCRVGGDALWLAGRGWQVTAVDFSTVALARAAAQADRLGPEVAGRVEWVHADLTRWAPRTSAFDLVSAQYFHLPPQDRDPAFARLAAAVAPGGRLLVVGHRPSELHTGSPDMFFTAEQVAATLDPAAWDVVVCEDRPRTASGPAGHELPVADTVLLARRT